MAADDGPCRRCLVKQMKDKNLDGGKLLETARALLAKYEKA